MNRKEREIKVFFTCQAVGEGDFAPASPGILLCLNHQVCYAKWDMLACRFGKIESPVPRQRVHTNLLEVLLPCTRYLDSFDVLFCLLLRIVAHSFALVCLTFLAFWQGLPVTQGQYVEPLRR